MAKYKNKNKKTTSVKDIDLIEEETDEEELEELEDELEEEVEKPVKKTKKVVEEDEDDEDDEYEEIPLDERLAMMEKKLNLTFVLVVIILVIGAFNLLISLTNKDNGTYGSEPQNTNQPSGTNMGYDTSVFNTITPDKIEEISKGKTVVIWLGSQECGHCQAYAPVLAQVSKEYGITANYVDVARLTQSGLDIIHGLKGSGAWEEFAASFNGTPFTIIVKNNKVVGGIVGAVSADAIADAFEDAGLKK